MDISEIVLKDFKAFKGENRLTLKQGDNSSGLILIGGMNGAGKTSILEAVKLCLYGRNCDSLWESKDIYEDFVLRRFNKKARREGKKDFFVELSFETGDIGQPSTISIRRTWIIKDGGAEGIEEDFKVSRDERLLEYVEPSYWQEYINNLIPPGVAQFFFFDGEKIKSMAESQNTKDQLNEAIRSLLNIELYSTLRNDLKRHIRSLNKRVDSNISQKLKEVDLDLEQTKIKLASKEKSKDALIRQLVAFEKENQRLEERLKKEAGVFAKKRDDLLKEKERLNEQIHSLTEKLQSLCGDLLPFAILPELMEKLQSRLKEEQIQKRRKYARSELKPKKQEIMNKLFENRVPSAKISGEQNEVLKQRFEKVWNEVIERPFSRDSIPLRHDLSISDSEKIFRQIDKAKLEIRSKIKNIINQRERLIYRRRKVIGELNTIKPGTAADETLDKIKAVSQKIGKQLELTALCDSEIVSFQKEINRKEQECNKLVDQAKLREKIQKKVLVCERIRDMLQKFIDGMTREKLEILKVHATKMFKRLAIRELFEEISINSETFDIELIDKEGRTISKESLSASEKEIYAISLLWGLLKASGKELPIIIDTPLGRLDSEHRRSVVTRYLPAAGHQVIVLCTDSEVDEELYSLLFPSISKSFTLIYHPEKKCTSLKDGYFFTLHKKHEKGISDAIQA